MSRVAMQQAPERVIDKTMAKRIATQLGWEPPKKPLTDEEIVAIGNASGLKAKMTTTGIIIHPDGAKRFARAIEAAHGIGEQK